MVDNKDLSPRQLLGVTRGNKKKAIAIYIKAHPDIDEARIVKRFDVAENARNLSVLQLLNAGLKFTDDYSEDAAINDYVEMHPEMTKEEARAELRRLEAQRDEKLRQWQTKVRAEKK